MTNVHSKSRHDVAHLAPLAASPRAGPRQYAPFGAVEDLIGRVAETDVTVLIRGERGTGKEIAARAIHAASPRHTRPFVKINCAAAPQLLESELFGWERGAIAGGGPQRPGRLEFANHGTLFLDQVSELPLTLQARLGRALREHEYARLVGGDRVQVEGRVLASTASDLERAVVEGRFREELFFLLNVVCLTLPPLRQRRNEIRELAQYFVSRYAAHYNKPAALLSGDTLRAFADYGWPGNLQELDAVVKRIVMLNNEHTACEELLGAAASLAGTETATPAPAPDEGITAAEPDPRVPLKEIARHAAEEAERELIYRTLQQTRWNRREAAEMLGVSYKALLYKIKRADLDGAS